MCGCSCCLSSSHWLFISSPRSRHRATGRNLAAAPALCTISTTGVSTAKKFGPPNGCLHDKNHFLKLNKGKRESDWVDIYDAWCNSQYLLTRFHLCWRKWRPCLEPSGDSYKDTLALPDRFIYKERTNIITSLQHDMILRSRGCEHCSWTAADTCAYIAQWRKYCTVTFYLEQHIAQWLLLGVKTSTSNPFLCAADFVNTNAHKQ